MHTRDERRPGCIKPRCKDIVSGFLFFSADCSEASSHSSDCVHPLNHRVDPTDRRDPRIFIGVDRVFSSARWLKKINKLCIYTYIIKNSCFDPLYTTFDCLMESFALQPKCPLVVEKMSHDFVLRVICYASDSISASYWR